MYEILIWILPFIFTAIFIIAVLIIISKRIARRYLNQSISSAARMLSQGLSEECTLPYSVPNMTAVYKPKINRDFPEMGYERMETMARNAMAEILNAVENEDPDGVSDSSSRLQNQLKGIIDDYAGRGERVHYDNVKIHAAAVTDYKSSADTASAVFQISLQSLAYRTREGSIVSGSNAKPTQNLFSLTLCYNQDMSGIGSKTFIERNCPNCGAPISSVKDRKCPFCGSGFVLVVDKIWQIDSFSLLK